MTATLSKALLAAQREQGGVHLVYGTATADNTVTVAGSTVAVTLPALVPVHDGDYVAILVAGADRLILGPVANAWTPFDPSWTNVTVGNSTEDFEYKYVDGDLLVRGTFTLGSSGSIDGIVEMDIPNGETASASCGSYGNGILNDSGTSNRPVTPWVETSGTAIKFATASGSSYVVATTNPFTWTTGDKIRFSIRIAL